MTRASRPPLLVLDGHTNQALATVRSLGRRGHAVYAASARWRPLAGWSRYCSGVQRVAESPAGMRALLAWAGTRGVAAVLPMTERSCILLNLARDEWIDRGILPACAPSERLDAAFDKYATIAAARVAGVAVPRTCAPQHRQHAERAAQAFGRAIVKPRRSHAWDGSGFLPDRGCVYAATPSEVLRAAEAGRQGEVWPLIQEIVPGCGKGVFSLWHEGRPLAWFAHERLRDVRPTGSGSSLRRAIPLDPRLREPAERLLRELQWHGPAMVEFRDDGETPWLMEVNGRFWNSLQLAIDAGIDFPRLWVEALLETPASSVHTDYRTDVAVRWIWGDVKRLLHIAAGRPQGYDGPFPSLRQGVREIVGVQPPGTRLETWRRGDPAPAVGEWVQGIAEVLRAGR